MNVMKAFSIVLRCGLLFLTASLAWLPNISAQAPSPKPNAEIPPNSTFVFGGSRSDFGTLTLDDGAQIAFVSTLDNVTITCDRLIVNGKAEINLTRNSSAPGTPPKPGTPGQAAPNGGNPQNGANGTPGGVGGAGASGINLVFRAMQSDLTNGSLWINTDGDVGGPGGPGGDGAKGSSGPNTCFHTANGGNGGTGGPGGPGGPGGNTGAIWFSVDGKIITPHPTSGVSPTARPPEANLSGAIVIAGNPGPGGPGGTGGAGGPAGEGHSKAGGFECPDTSSSSGANGAHGANGPQGPTGRFTTTAPPNLAAFK
jgi:hypothetical protein